MAGVSGPMRSGSQVYVANSSTGAITVIGVPSYAVAKTIPSVGPDPIALVYRPGPSSPAPSGPTTAKLALSASPAGSSTQGASVTLTANVTPSTATGVVTFYDGTQALGGPVTVSGGSASLSVTALAAGQHSLSAQFVPDSTAYTSATSPATPYLVNVPGATATSTALAVSPSDTAPEHTPVALTATVTPAGASGTVQFVDTRSGIATPVGGPVTVGADGTAALTTTALPSGQHTLGAVFTPTSTSAYDISASAGVAYQVTALATGATGENITTTVLPGALVISVANSQVVLPSPVLDSAGDLMTTSGNLNPITLTDTRAGNPGWTVSCQVGDFSDGGANRINGQNLGLAPQIIDLSAAQHATVGNAVTPAAVEAGDTGQGGLKSAQTLVTGQGLGTAHFGGGLTLNVPTDTAPGTYTATMTITAI
ncbi:MAG TPA: Ig-like domain repeat protein [Actinocrinis sp.]|uniref:Ig-like domain repeat protein n=1 Tax=Actinocrinis sp. TaxID=1920516 RepID=UPI002DDCC1C9|nr:Ig-like domain repeat protein [Actinocrinis sp.]HEV2348090.1 Ig-like domain repeat protein [Actinocrinis sp.]